MEGKGEYGRRKGGSTERGEGRGLGQRFQAAAVLLECVLSLLQRCTPLQNLLKAALRSAFPPKLHHIRPSLACSLARSPFASFGCCSLCSPLWRLCARSAHHFFHPSGRQQSTAWGFHRCQRAFGVCNLSRFDADSASSVCVCVCGAP